MSKKNLTIAPPHPVLKVVISSLLAQFSGQKGWESAFLQIAANASYDLLLYHELTPLFFLLFKNATLTANASPLIDSRFRRDFYHTIQQNARFETLFLEVLKTAKKLNVQNEMVPIKGMGFLIQYYTRFPARPMADVDIMVRQEHVSAWKELLIGLKFDQAEDSFGPDYWIRHHFQLPMVRNGRSGAAFGNEMIELHWGLDFRRSYPIVHAAWDRLEEVLWHEMSLKVLSAEDQILSLALHQRRFSKPFLLKHVFDTLLIIRAKASALDWGYLVAEAYRSRMRVCLWALLTQVSYFEKSEQILEVCQRLRISRFRKVLLSWIQKRAARAIPPATVKSLFLFQHFMIFDSLLEAIGIAVKMPYGQFCKLYNLHQNTKSRILYQVRHFYGIQKWLRSMVGFKRGH